MPDREVVECLVREFALLRVPKPEREPVNVVYPIIFRPGD